MLDDHDGRAQVARQPASTALTALGPPVEAPMTMSGTATSGGAREVAVQPATGVADDPDAGRHSRQARRSSIPDSRTTTSTAPAARSSAWPPWGWQPGVAVDHDGQGVGGHQVSEGRQHPVRKVGIKDDDGGPQLGGQVEQIDPRSGLAEDHESGVDGKQRSHRATTQGVATGHENADVASRGGRPSNRVAQGFRRHGAGRLGTPSRWHPPL